MKLLTMCLTVLWFLVLPGISLSSPAPKSECQDNHGTVCSTRILSEKTILENTNRQLENNTSTSFLEDSFSLMRDNLLNTDDRTWRINHKALGPILIGMAVKGVAIIFFILSILSIMGATAIFVSKVSLFLSMVMFIKRFFSFDTSAGGFLGLNPLGFPHAPLAQQDKYNGSGHRKTIHLGRAATNYSIDIDEWLQGWKMLWENEHERSF